MKTTMRNRLIIGLLAVAGIASAVSYTPYKATQKPVYDRPVYEGLAVAPSAGFQSTSMYSGQWNQDAQQSMLNSDGSVNESAYGVGNTAHTQNRPRKISNPDDDVENPIGDAVLPLLLLAAGYVILQRKR